MLNTYVDMVTDAPARDGYVQSFHDNADAQISSDKNDWLDWSVCWNGVTDC